MILSPNRLLAIYLRMDKSIKDFTCFLEFWQRQSNNGICCLKVQNNELLPGPHQPAQPLLLFFLY